MVSFSVLRMEGVLVAKYQHRPFYISMETVSGYTFHLDSYRCYVGVLLAQPSQGSSPY